jgi:hypothetical protein
LICHAESPARSELRQLAFQRNVSLTIFLFSGVQQEYELSWLPTVDAVKRLSAG